MVEVDGWGGEWAAYSEKHSQGGRWRDNRNKVSVSSEQLKAVRRKARLGLVCSAILNLTILTERICLQLFLECNTGLALSRAIITLWELEYNLWLVSFKASFLFCSVLLIGCLPSEWPLHLFLEHLFALLLQYFSCWQDSCCCSRLFGWQICRNAGTWPAISWNMSGLNSAVSSQSGAGRRMHQC